MPRDRLRSTRNRSGAHVVTQYWSRPERAAKPLREATICLTESSSQLDAFTAMPLHEQPRLTRFDEALRLERTGPVVFR